MIRSIILCVFSAWTIVSTNNVHEMKIGKGFSWRNCDTANALVHFRSLSVSPNPIKYGQNIVLSAVVEVTQDIGTTNTVEADVIANEVYKGQKFDMCQYKPEFCHIEDLCNVISKTKMQCPDVVEKLGSNCHCPLKKNTYDAKDISIKIPNSKVQIEGQFEVTLNVKESGKPIGCLFVAFCLGECSID